MALIVQSPQEQNLAVLTQIHVDIVSISRPCGIQVEQPADIIAG